ncbi:transposable element Tcb2 transposase [Trichonephila clavipes]|nr:transposable element Tcb2 transposase [Trichonephila clavipes]
MGSHCLQYTATPSINPRHHDMLQPHVLSLMQRLPGAIFQQDKVRPHTARVSQDCLHTVTTLSWPARSPYLSLIEHIWDHLRRRVGHLPSLNELEASTSTRRSVTMLKRRRLSTLETSFVVGRNTVDARLYAPVSGKTAIMMPVQTVFVAQNVVALFVRIVVLQTSPLLDSRPMMWQYDPARLA